MSENAAPPEKRFYGVKEIQQIFSISRNTALSLLKSEGFPAMKMGRTYKVEKEALDEWIKEHTNGGKIEF